MAGMFDGFAKRAARRAQSAADGHRGISRRRVVIGAAWTAPVLAATAATSAWAASVGELGGSCGNLGQGTCNQPYHCNGNVNQCNNCVEPNICGGEGASCCDTSQCDNTDPAMQLVCAPQDATYLFCRRVCTSNANCNAGQVCHDYGGGALYCAEPCTNSSTCLGSAVCSNGVCTYQPDSQNVTCP